MQDIPQNTLSETTKTEQSARIDLWEIDLTDFGGQRCYFSNEANEKGESVTFGVQALVSTTSKGDRNPASVNLQIQLRRNGIWQVEKDITINGKTTSQYLASVVVDNLPPRPFDIRMVRTTADSTSDQLQNKTLWYGYTEIIDVKQRYAHAHAGP